MFVNHMFVKAGENPPSPGACLYEYLVGANGIHVRAHRPGLAVTIPLGESTSDPVRGLENIETYVRLTDKIPYRLIEQILLRSLLHLPNERLFYLLPDPWRLVEPAAMATPGSVHPVDGFNQAAQAALVEIHSHGHLAAFWSGTDNKDETGLRLYGVLGGLPNRPTLRMRVGVYGHWYEIDLMDICDVSDDSPLWPPAEPIEAEPVEALYVDLKDVGGEL